MSEPLPCPFCKSMPLRDPHPPLMHRDGEWIYFGCFNEECPAMPDVRGKAEAELIARWNTRAPDSRDAQLREAWRTMFNLGLFGGKAEAWLRANWSHKPSDISADWLRPEGRYYEIIGKCTGVRIGTCTDPKYCESDGYVREITKEEYDKEDSK